MVEEGVSKLGLALCLAVAGWVCAAGCRTGVAGDAATGPGRAVVEAGGVEEESLRVLPGYRAEMVAAPVFGGRVFVMEAGDPAAAAVVLVHGLGQNGCRDFYPVLPGLASRFHVVTFDLPGFGRSTHGTELYSPERYTEFMHQLLGSRVRRPFYLVGHSMGGALALTYAWRFADDVARLVMIDAAGMLHRKAFVNFAVDAAVDSYLGALSRPVKDLAQAAGQVSSVGPQIPGSDDPSVILQNASLRAAVLQTPERIAALAVILENFAPAMYGVRAPAWLLWGSNDAIASPRIGRVLQARLPAARLTVLDGSGHDPMASRPAAVDAFLAEALSAAALDGATDAKQASSPTARVGRCERQRGVRFEGDYASIDVVDCQDVVLTDVRASSVRMRSSEATLDRVHVSGGGAGLWVEGSRVMVTASEFSGDVGLVVDGSDLDLAGVELRGQRASIHANGPSQLIVSISRIESPVASGYLHGVYDVGKGKEL
jgi:pimeloyl-ACP methyl ester carboxylesterase